MIAIDFAYLPLSRGMFAKISQEDLAMLLDYVWHAIPCGKAWRARGYKRGGPTNKRVYMHSLITGLPYVDHIDRDPLNNTRENLRSADHSLNMRNTRTSSNTGYLGVTYSAKRNRFIAQISVGGRGNVRHRAKYFKTVEEAVEYRKQLVKEFFGDDSN